MQSVLTNKVIMRCQLGFHDQSKKSLVLFFQEKSAVFSKTVFGLEGALVTNMTLRGELTVQYR